MSKPMPPAASSIHLGDQSYSYIDPNAVYSHQYEELQTIPNTRGKPSSNLGKGSRREQPTPVQPAAPAGGGTQNNNCCRRPPCWGWAVLIIGLVIAAAVVAILAFLLTSSAKTAGVMLPVIQPSTPTPAVKASATTAGDMMTVIQPSTPTPAVKASATTAGDMMTVIQPSTPTPAVLTSPASPTITTTSANPKNCQEVYANGGTTSAVYPIYPDGKTRVRVQCEQTLGGGGWTVFQRRIDGSVSFFQNWATYRQGFGNPSREYWLGNANLHTLTANRDTQLLVELEYGGETLYANYTEFWLLTEDMKFELHVAGYTGGDPPGDSLEYHNGSPFTTHDRDNDGRLAHNCASRSFGAWWYSDCHRSNLNGKYGAPTATGLIWYTWKTFGISMTGTRMMVKTRSE